MAGRLILFKNTDTPIAGTCIVADYKDQLELESLNMNAEAYYSGEGGGNADQSGIAISVAHGPWIAQFQQALYHGKSLGEVTLSEIEQAGEGAAKTWRLIRKVTLTKAYCASLSHGWQGTYASHTLELQFLNFTYNSGDKAANFNKDEKTS